MIPQPAGWPLLGNILSIDTSDTWGSFKRLADQHGPIFKLNLLGNEIVIVASTALAQEVGDEARFRKCIGAASFTVMRAAVHDALFTAFAHEKSWGIAHRIMIPFVAPAGDIQRINEIQTVARILTTKWKGTQSGKVDLIADMKSLTSQAAMAELFNAHYNLLAGEGPPVVALLDAISWEMVKRASRPELLTWLFYHGVYEKQISEFRSLAADLIAAKRAEPTPRKDMLYALLHAQDPETGEVLDEQRAIDEVITMFITSSTTAGLIPFTLYYMLKNPTTLAKAQSEVESVVGSSERITPDHLDTLPYLEACMMEALRLAATAPGYLVEPIPDTKDLTLGGHPITPTQRIMVLLGAVNRDPAVFNDPDTFAPDRMMPEARAALPDGAKKWFGNGKRRCFGQRFAVQLTMITLIEMLRSFDIAMADPNYQLRSTGKEIGGFFRAPCGLFLTVTPRSTST